MPLEEIRKKAVPLLKSYGVTRAAVFGSVARGDEHPDSDIDMLVQMPEEASLFDFVGLKFDLEELLKKKIDLVSYGGIKPRLRERILHDQKIIL